MQRNQRIFAATMAAALIGTSLIAPLAARASEEGKRNTTLGLGAAAAALLLTQRNKTAGLLTGAGAVYAYSQYEKDINNRHKRERAQAYRAGYRNGKTARYHTSRHR